MLADRVGIIDHGKIVAEGTPQELKATIGRPTVVATPKDPEQLDRASAILARFGEPTRTSPGATAVMLNGKGDLADVLRALDGEGVLVDDLRMHAASLDDVFLAKTGRMLEGEEEQSE